MAKQKKSNNKSKLFGIVYIFIAVVIFLFLLFNDKGILKYLEVKNRLDKLDTKIEASENQIDKIEAEIDSLKTSRFKIEKTAREKYNMRRPNEKGLDIEVK